MEPVETAKYPTQPQSAEPKPTTGERIGAGIGAAIAVLDKAPATIDTLHNLVKGIVKVGTKIVYGTMAAAVDGINEARAELKDRASEEK